MLDILPAPVYLAFGIAAVITVISVIRSYFRSKALERETEKFWNN